MIGNLKPIKLLKYAETIDANGDATESVQISYKMWAEVTDEGGGRSQDAGRTELGDSKTFKIYFRGYNITPNYKIQYFGQEYAISNAKRIDEKRFNWEISAYAIFELTGGGGQQVQNWTDVTLDQVNGYLTLSGGSDDENLTLLQVLAYPYNGTNYVNAYGESFGTGNFSGATAPMRCLFTPGKAIIAWKRVAPNPPYEALTGTVLQEITIVRLSRRYFFVYNKFNNQIRAQNDFPLKAYDVNDTYLGIANNAAQYISLMNGSAANQACFNMVEDNSDAFGMSFNCDPISPYQTWNFGPPLRLYVDNV